MTAHHFFVDDVGSDPIVLTGDEAHHAARVSRVRAGEVVTVSDGRGTVVHGIVVGTPSSERVVIDERKRLSIPASRPAVHVFPAVPKGGKLDVVVQQLTEVGVDRITPWFAERSVAQWDEKKCVAQGERLRSVARAAAKQSRRAWLPIVDDPGKITGLSPTCLVLHEGASAPLVDALRDAKTPAMVSIITGPEGGLTDAERDQLKGAGGIEVSLGPLILRTETAPIVGCVLVRSAFHLLG